MEGLLIYFYLLDRRILFKSSVFLYHIQHFFRRSESIYPLVHKAYSDFYDLQLSKILPYTTAFSTPLSTSIRCWSRGRRGYHGLQLINKTTTYNIFERPSNPPIRWCSRITSVIGTCNCQTFLSLISFYLQHALYVL